MDADRERDPDINLLFHMVRKNDASGLELRPGSPPQIWLQGQLATSDLRPLTAEDMDRLLRPILSLDQWERLGRGEGVAFSYSIQEGVRFWVSVVRLGGGLQLSAKST